jgi:phenylpropionate dioxygenase-like ring-hydroxylating dioxygenase large terminal subunit
VAYERVTDKTKPYPFELLNIPIVLWHDASTQTWATVEDKCPHRLAPLSEGRIDPENNCLECPYHGWTFDSKGTCTKIPQLEEGDPEPQTRTAAAVAAFPTTVAQGIIWVWGQSVQSLLATGQPLPDANLVPLCPPLLEEDVVCLDVSRDLPYSYETLLENILDPSHVPYTHHNTIGRRSYATPVPLKMTEEVSPVGFGGTWERNMATSPMMTKWMGQVMCFV